jgi:uncharacterized membrane-anchored protein
MSKILNFYRPFTSPMMPLRFQRNEILVPIIMSVFFGLLGSLPQFMTGHWLVGIVLSVASTVLFYTLYTLVMRSSSYTLPDGTQRISPSLQTPALSMSVMLWLLLTVIFCILNAAWRFDMSD